MFLPPGILLKYLVILKSVIQAGNHTGNDIEQCSGTPDRHTLCFYYIDGFEFMSGSDLKPETCLENPTQVDRTMYRYKESLEKNINKVLLTLPKQCN